MRFALLGIDSESAALARAAEAAGHTIVWCGDGAAQSPGDSGWGSSGDTGGDTSWGLDDLGDEWESLLDQNMADGVIVGRGGAAAGLRGEQVNQLVKNGVAVLATFPLVDSVLVYYEIDMARGESNAVLQHFNPLTEHCPTIDQCADSIAHGHPQLGPIEQVVLERALAERTQEQVLWHFSRDVELLDVVAGQLNRLGALGSPDEAATYSGLSVQLLGKSEVPVRWQVGPVEQAAWAHLILIAERGRLIVALSEAGSPWQLSVSQNGETETTALADFAASGAREAGDAASKAVGRFVDAVAAGDGDASSWPRALRAMELTDTIEISLRRGRMIEVHQQQLTEELAFKGTMSALGCGVLLVVPPLLLVFGWLAELMGLSVARFWPHLVLTFFALFLGLQLIPKLIFDDPHRGHPDRGQPDRKQPDRKQPDKQG